MRRWISCEKKLPPIGQVVCVFITDGNKYKNVLKSWRKKDGDWNLHWGGEITHWLPVRLGKLPRIKGIRKQAVKCKACKSTCLYDARLKTVCCEGRQDWGGMCYNIIRVPKRPNILKHLKNAAWLQKILRKIKKS